MTEPTSPIAVGHYSTPGGLGYNLFVEDRRAYLANGNWGLDVIDITDPTSPFSLGSFVPSSGSFYDVAVVDKVAYIAANDGLHVIDLDDPSFPEVLGHYESQYGCKEITLSDGIAYLSNNIGSIVDVSNPFQPECIGMYGHPGWANGLAVQGTTVLCFK